MLEKQSHCSVDRFVSCQYIISLLCNGLINFEEVRVAPWLFTAEWYPSPWSIRINEAWMVLLAKGNWKDWLRPMAQFVWRGNEFYIPWKPLPRFQPGNGNFLKLRHEAMFKCPNFQMVISHDQRCSFWGRYIGLKCIEYIIYIHHYYTYTDLIHVYIQYKYYIYSIHTSAQIIARTAEATRQVAGISEVSP